MHVSHCHIDTPLSEDVQRHRASSFYLYALCTVGDLIQRLGQVRYDCLCCARPRRLQFRGNALPVTILREFIVGSEYFVLFIPHSQSSFGVGQQRALICIILRSPRLRHFYASHICGYFNGISQFRLEIFFLDIERFLRGERVSG